MILEHLQPLDLLQATQTCRETANLLKSSKRVRKAMCLEANGDAEPFLPFRDRTSIAFPVVTDLLSKPRASSPAKAQIFVQFKRNVTLPHLGERARSILVCLPPAKDAIVSPNCCPEFRIRNGVRGVLPFRGDPGASDHGERLAISSTNGITLGNILDAAQKCRDEHQLWPFAWLALLDKKGFVMVDVRIKIPEFEVNGHPSQALWRHAVDSLEREASLERKHCNGGKNRMYAYTQAKRDGKLVTPCSGIIMS